MLKLGEKIISDIYLGDKKIAKVFLGDKLVYQANKPIFLDYIIFDGNSYIDTEYKPNSNSSVKVGYKPHYNTVFGCIMGTQDSVTANRFYALISSTLYKLQINSANSSSFWGVDSTGLISGVNGSFSSTAQATILTIDNYNKQISIESKELTKTFNMADYNATLGTIDCNYNLLLGNRGTAGVPPATNGFKGEISCFQIKESGELIQDLRPCIHPNGTVCFYDMVTKKYFYNQGTGTLTAGNVIKFVDYIESDGNSYIDTGIVLSSNHKVSIRAMVTVANPSAVVQLFGNYSDPAGAFTCNIGNNVGAISRFDGVSFTGKNLYKSDSKFHTYTVDKKGIIVDTDSILSWSGTPTDFQQSESFYLFCARGSTSRTANGTQISEEKVWENDTLIQHLKPCVVAGEACFYDMVTGNVFTNAGTGTLKASGRFVESIVGDGASWINPNYIMTSDVQEVECIFQYTDSTDTQQMFGLNIAGKDAGIYPSTSGSNIFIRGGSGSYVVNFVMDYTKKHTLYAKAELGQPFIATFDGETKQSTNPIDVINTTHPWYLFGLNKGDNASAVYCYKGKIYLFKMYDNGVLVRDLRPYVDENGTACFKDIVTGKLFYNQGTGKLEYTE